MPEVAESHRPAALGGPGGPNSGSQPGWYVAGCFVLLLIGLYLAAGPAVQLSRWHVLYEVNPAFQEGLAWRSGNLELPRRTIDTALYNGRAYSVHPPCSH